MAAGSEEEGEAGLEERVFPGKTNDLSLRARTRSRLGWATERIFGRTELLNRKISARPNYPARTMLLAFGSRFRC